VGGRAIAHETIRSVDIAAAAKRIHTGFGDR
jgi:hypothetical protein